MRLSPPDPLVIRPIRGNDEQALVVQIFTGLPFTLHERASCIYSTRYELDEPQRACA